MSKILFIPVGIAGGLVAGGISKKLFDLLWSRVSKEEAPEPEHREVSWPQLVAALALQGAIFRVSRGVVERWSRIGYYRLTGSWPGEEEPESTT
ncbi:MAG TPA: DUF4235 domain-containing protein [Solirubrobacterales bacterium]|jgi:hypothetical protein|nr:DUF4235 domain-containing protein [Solirubrobacterales bacterium]